MSHPQRTHAHRFRPDGPLAIRVDPDTLLSVPRMHPATPSAVRVRVFELILRRLYGEAADMAAYAADVIEGRLSETARTTAMLSATPHRSARGTSAA